MLFPNLATPIDGLILNSIIIYLKITQKLPHHHLLGTGSYIVPKQIEHYAEFMGISTQIIAGSNWEFIHIAQS